MKYIERDEETRKSDIKRAMRYSYRKSKVLYRRFNYSIFVFFLISLIFFIFVLSVWGFLSCL